MFEIRQPAYVQSYSKHKNRTGIKNMKQTSSTLPEGLLLNSLGKSTLRNSSPSQSRFWSLNIGKSTPVIISSNYKLHDNKFNHGLQTEKNTRQTPEKREKISHIAFLKVHKAGSTTMLNIFFRFGLNHNLNILVPREGNFLHKASDQMPIDSSKHYDIFACHTIYNKRLFDSLLPADSVKIGIVREPIERMISAAYYYRDVWHVRYLTRVPKEDFIHNLVKYPEKYEQNYFSHTRNGMARDFGFSKKLKPTDTQNIKAYLDNLNEEFLLVLTVEKLEASLILMKRLLRWSISDVLYLKINSHEHKPISLNKDEISKFRNTSFIDFEIYEYFKQVLDEKLEMMANDFWEEVAYFKKLLIKVSKFCFQRNAEIGDLIVKESAWCNKFNISQSQCKIMKTTGAAFIDQIRERQKEMDFDQLL